MLRRTTIELDEDLLERAKRVLGRGTTRATVEEALRRVVEDGESAHADRDERQRRFLVDLSSRVDVEVLAAEAMWR